MFVRLEIGKRKIIPWKQKTAPSTNIFKCANKYTADQREKRFSLLILTEMDLQAADGHKSSRSLTQTPYQLVVKRGKEEDSCLTYQLSRKWHFIDWRKVNMERTQASAEDRVKWNMRVISQSELEKYFIDYHKLHLHASLQFNREYHAWRFPARPVLCESQTATGCAYENTIERK